MPDIPVNLQLTTNAAGVAIIKAHEALALTTYICPRGRLTIGWGHTGADVHPGMTITEDRATALLARDRVWAEQTVIKHVHVALSQNAFSALVSLVFNIGAGEFETSTLLKLLNAGDYSGAAGQFPEWCHCNGKIEPGLVARREVERSLFIA